MLLRRSGPTPVLTLSFGSIGSPTLGFRPAGARGWGGADTALRPSRRSTAGGYDDAAEPSVPSLVMDRPTRLTTPALGPIARDFAEGERLREFAERPGRCARLGAAPAALPRRSPRGARRARSSVVLPDDAQARDAAEGAGWFLGEERVGLFAVARRALGSGSRAAAAPRGRARPCARGPRRRAASCARRRSALAEGLPPAEARPEPIALARRRRARRRRRSPSGLPSPATSGCRRPRSAASSPSAAGSSTSSPRPAASRCASSCSATRSSRSAPSRPFTQRTLHGARVGDGLPGGRAAPRPASSRCLREDGEPPPLPDDLVRAAADARPRLAGGRGARRSCARSSARPWTSTGALRADPAPGGQPPRFEAQRPAVAARGLAEAERDLLGYVRAATGSSSRSRTAARRSGRRPCCGDSTRSFSTPGDELPDEPGLFFAVSPARRGFVLRDLDLILLPDTQVFRKRPPRADARSGARSRASPTCARATTSSTRTTASASCSASRRRPSPASRATTSSWRSAATTASTSRTSRSARSRATSARTGTRRRSRSWAARPGRRSRTAPARARTSSRASCSPSTRSASAPRASPSRPTSELVERARGELRLRGDAGPAAGDRGGQGGPRDAAADGPARLRRRRLRKDRGGHARRLRRGGERRAGAPARADDHPRAAALEHLPRALPRPARDGRDGLALPQARRREAGARGLRRRARSTSSSARTACSRGTSSRRTSAS